MERSWRAGALALCLLTPGLMHAAPSSEVRQSLEVRRYLNAAVALYEKLEYEQALKQIGRAKKKAATADDEARVALMEGIVLAELGRESAANDAFTTGFGLDAEAKLPLDVSPKVAALAEAARESVKKLLGSTLDRQRAEAEAQRAAELEAARSKAAAEAPAPTPPPLPPLEALPPRAKAPAPKVATSPQRDRTAAWIALAVAGATTGGSVAYLTSAAIRQRALVSGTIDDPVEAKASVAAGKREALAGIFLGVAAGAALVTSVTLFLIDTGPANKATSVALVPLAGGGGLVALTGQFPH